MTGATRAPRIPLSKGMFRPSGAPFRAVLACPFAKIGQETRFGRELWAPSSLDTGILPGLLSSLPVSPVAGQGCALRTALAANRQWQDCGISVRRWTPSPLRAARGLRQPLSKTADNVQVQHRRRIPEYRLEATIPVTRWRATRISWRREKLQNHERLPTNDQTKITAHSFADGVLTRDRAKINPPGSRFLGS